MRCGDPDGWSSTVELSTQTTAEWTLGRPHGVQTGNSEDGSPASHLCLPDLPALVSTLLDAGLTRAPGDSGDGWNTGFGVGLSRAPWA